MNEEETPFSDFSFNADDGAFRRACEQLKESILRFSESVEKFALAVDCKLEPPDQATD